MLLQETRQERAMMNYQKHAKKWDRYEQHIQNHFDRKNIIRYGSKDNHEKALQKKHDKQMKK